MKRVTLAVRRLAAQQIDQPAFDTPSEVVAWLGAVQAQDYASSKWGVGLRLAARPDAQPTEASIDAALEDGTVLRTHVFRGTWQLVVPADIRWMLSLAGPRIIALSARRYRELELDEPTLKKTSALLAKALRGGQHLTRAAIAALLEKARISSAGQRLVFILMRAELDAIICSGKTVGKQRTWALLDELVPLSKSIDRREAISALAARYFSSRGPATVDDFAWWAGLGLADARAGLEAVRGALVSEGSGKLTSWRAETLPVARRPLPAAHDEVVLLPAFDEYLVAYRDRSAVLAVAHVKRINAGGGLLAPCIIRNGDVIGIWHRTFKRSTVEIGLDYFEPPSPSTTKAVERASRRFRAFVARPDETLARSD